jgi:hypothetical protein
MGGKRRRPREKQSPEVAQTFEALNQVHASAPSPDPEVAKALKQVRMRLIALEKDHNHKVGSLAQVERWAARCTAVMSFFLLHPLMAWWEASGYPHPGKAFWADENVVAALGSGLGWIAAVMIVARVVVGAILGWLFILIVGCLMFAFLFRGV